MFYFIFIALILFYCTWNHATTQIELKFQLELLVFNCQSLLNTPIVQWKQACNGGKVSLYSVANFLLRLAVKES